MNFAHAAPSDKFMGWRSKPSPILTRHEQFLPRPTLSCRPGLAHTGLRHVGRGCPNDDPGDGHPPESRSLPGTGVLGTRHHHLRFRAGDLGAAGRLGPQPALRRHSGRQAWHPPGRPGRQPVAAGRRSADGHCPGHPADRAGSRRADRRGAVLHDLGHLRQHRRARRAADPTDAGLRHRLGGRLGRHHADRAGRRLSAGPSGLAGRLVGSGGTGCRHVACGLVRQPCRCAAQRRGRRARTQLDGCPS